MTKLDFQLGKVEKINDDGSINIRDFRTGGMLYQNVPIEHNAINQQQPVEGQHLLFFTTGGTGDAHQSELIKVVRMYGNITADKSLVLASPIDMAPGEGKMISQTGATVYVGNGGLSIESAGQSVTLDDASQLMSVICQNLNLFTQDGFGITKGEDATLFIKKGTLTLNNGQENIKDVKVNISINDKNVQVSGRNASINLDLTSGKLTVSAQSIELNGTTIELNGTTGVARSGDTVKVTIPPGTVLMASSPGVGSPIVTGSPIDVTGTITSASTTVKAG